MASGKAEHVRQLQNQALALADMLGSTVPKEENRLVKDEILNLKISQLKEINSWMKTRIRKARREEETSSDDDSDTGIIEGTIVHELRHTQVLAGDDEIAIRERTVRVHEPFRYVLYMYSYLVP